MADRESIEIAFVCRRCNALSPMAARLSDQMGEDPLRTWAVGLDPDGRILPGTLTALREVGIDTSDLVPVPARRARLQRADAVVAIGIEPEEHDVLAGLGARTWDVADPQGGQLAAFRDARDELGLRVRQLLRELGAGPVEQDEGPTL